MRQAAVACTNMLNRLMMIYTHSNHSPVKQVRTAKRKRMSAFRAAHINRPPFLTCTHHHFLAGSVRLARAEDKLAANHHDEQQRNAEQPQAGKLNPKSGSTRG